MNNALLTPADKFKEDGFCVFNNAIPPVFIHQLMQHAHALIQQQTKMEKDQFRSLGSMISLWRDPFFSSLITHPTIINHLKSLGTTDLRYSNGYLLAKPPHSVPTFWHQDWWLWSSPDSYTPFVHQIGVLCYLQDVTTHNGALRVIPGSHRRAHPLHPLLKNIDNDALRRAENPTTQPFQSQVDEVALELKQGDIVLIDARLLHGAYANQSDLSRYGITLWYYPHYHLFSSAIKARIGTIHLAHEWSNQLKKMQPLLPNYSGDSTPQTIINYPTW